MAMRLWGAITITQKVKVNSVILKGNRDETNEEKLKRLSQERELDKKRADDAKKSPYRRFLQMNKDTYKAEDWLMQESPAAYRILRYISQNMDNYNALICSYQVFQEVLGYSRATIARSLKLLKKHKYIDSVKTGGANIYFINKNLYWNSYGTNYARAEFGAKIIISASEQDKIEQQEIQMELIHRNEVRIKSDDKITENQTA